MLPDAAHIHPALVHFPIALLILGTCADLVVLLRSQSLTGRGCLPVASTAALLLGAAFAVPTAIVGDAAFDQAVSLGFPQGPLLLHHNFGIATTVLWAVLGLGRLFARWKGYDLSGRRGWAYWGLCLAGLAALVTTAYFGGHLVYDLGVNIPPHGGARP